MERERDRNLMIKDYLNKTFDDIKKIDSSLVSERRAQGYVKGIIRN